MPPYTNISKPTGASYTNVNKAPGEIPLYGTAIYGTTRYGIIDNYTDVSKPTPGSLTWDQATFSWNSAIGTWNDNIYINIPKPT